MRTYKRQTAEGGCYFFTVNLANRQNNDLLIREIAALREAFRQTRVNHPFENVDGVDLKRVIDARSAGASAHNLAIASK